MLNTEHDDSILHTVCIHSDVSSGQLIDLILFFLSVWFIWFEWAGFSFEYGEQSRIWNGG